MQSITFILMKNFQTYILVGSSFQLCLNLLCTAKCFACNNSLTFDMAQLDRASSPGLCRVERPGFKPYFDHQLFISTLGLL